MENEKNKPKGEASNLELPNLELPNEELPKRETRSFIVSREPSLDRRNRPCPVTKLCLFNGVRFLQSSESFSDGTDTEGEYTPSLVVEAPCTSSSAEIMPLETGPQVYLRLRPVTERSTAYSISEDRNVFITTNTANRREKHFGFTSIFDSSVDQGHIYDTCVRPRICDEECVTIMTYGTSGSGKTYTLLGNDVSAGIIPRALDNIFTICKNSVCRSPKIKLVNGCIICLQDDASLMEMQIRKKLLDLCPDIGQGLKKEIEEDHTLPIKTGGSKESVLIWVSFVEIYNELVHDLLEIPPKPPKGFQEVPRKNLKVVCNKGQVYVKGLTSVFVQSSEEALRLLRLGQQRSTFASTSVNANSSRSHCVFTVDMIKYNRSGITTQSSYKFCDLAGSERVNSTGTTGQRLKEAKKINTSLMVLGRCLDAASTAQRKKSVDVIPYRDSKLTMLLQAALLGKEKLAMIVTVSPVDRYYEENQNVLNFASIAKNILFKVPVIKQHRSSYAGFMEFSTMTADAKGSEYTKELEEKNVNLQLEFDRLKYVFMLQSQLLQKTKKAYQDHYKQKLLVAQEQAQTELSGQKRRYEAEIKCLRDKIVCLLNPGTDLETTQETEQSQSVIEVVDDDE